VSANPVSLLQFVPKEQPRPDLFRHLFSGSTNALAVVSGRGQIISTNLAFRQILGYAEDELRTMNCDEVSALLAQGASRSVLKFPTRPPFAGLQWEATLVCKDQSLVPARIAIDRIEPSYMGDFVSLVIVEDITQRQTRETQLSESEAEVKMLASLLIQSQESERKRLSRELHDNIGQRLSLAASDAAVLASQQRAGSALANRLEYLRSELDSLCTDIHEMSHDLHSYKLQHLGLEAALKDLSRRLSQQDFHVDLYASNLAEPRSKDVALCLYRVAQESLNNAFKHAHTVYVSANITKRNGVFYLTIKDSGVGFDCGTRSQGLGLVSMRERITLVDGTLRIRSVPGQGTEVRVAVPDHPEPN
jgi:PAS domain S-box-containing protein